MNQTRKLSLVLLLAALFSVCISAHGQQKKKALEDASLQADAIDALITTDVGVVRIEFFPQKAPKHVEHFISLAKSGFYNGSAFHRVVPGRLIQGGDPVLKDPQSKHESWGSGGLRELPDEFSDIKHVRGTVSTARIEGEANSGGTQFFICASAIPQIDGKFSAFAQVTEGIEVVDRISRLETDARQTLLTPVRIKSIELVSKKVEPFRDSTPAQLRREVLLRTTFGEITVELYPDLAPEHVRNFLKLVETGWYDHTAFHRIVPGFVIQGGIGATRAGGASHPADRWVRPLHLEVSATPHVRGILSMARGDNPSSAMTSFFMMLGPAPHLDGKYTVFGRVVDGLEVLDIIARVPRDGETPRQRIELIEAAIKP